MQLRVIFDNIDIDIISFPSTSLYINVYKLFSFIEFIYDINNFIL